MSPLGILTVGLITVLVSPYFGVIGVVPELLGWVACALAARRLSPTGERWRQVLGISVVASGVQVLLLVAALGDLRLGRLASSVVSIVDIAVVAALVVAVCTTFIEVLPEAPLGHDFKPTGTIREAFLIRAIYLAVACLLIVLIIVAFTTETVFAAAGPLFLLLVLFGIFIWFITLVYRLRAHPKLQAA